MKRRLFSLFPLLFFAPTPPTNFTLKMVATHATADWYVQQLRSDRLFPLDTDNRQLVVSCVDSEFDARPDGTPLNNSCRLVVTFEEVS